MLQTISTRPAATLAMTAAAAPPPGAGSAEPSALSHSPSGRAPAAGSVTADIPSENGLVRQLYRLAAMDLVDVFVSPLGAGLMALPPIGIEAEPGISGPCGPAVMAARHGGPARRWSR